MISDDGFNSATMLSQNNPGVDNTAPFYDAPGTNYPISPAADFQLLPGTTYEIRAYLYNAPSTTARWDDFYTFMANDPTGHLDTFTEGGTPKAIALPAAEIEDAAQANMVSGTVNLINKQTDDRLVINGVVVSNGSTGTVSGISYTVTETAGTISVTLSGSATKAAYATALGLIAFDRCDGERWYRNFKYGTNNDRG
jgi:hypothetical protein